MLRRRRLQRGLRAAAVDVLAGLAVAELVRRAEPLAAPLVRAVVYALE